MSFDKQKWVVEHIINPGLLGHLAITNETKERDELVPVLRIQHLMTRGPAHAPTELYIAVECGDGLAEHVHRLLTTQGMKFDYYRDLAHVAVDGKRMILFGSDGAPFIRDDATVLVRFFKKVDDKNLILDIGKRHKRALEAQGAIKTVFSKFDGLDPVQVLKQFQPAFGE